MGFGGGGIWIFGLLVLLALLFGGNGNGLFGGNRGPMFPPNVATSGDVQRATDFAALERQNNEGVAATRQGVYDVAAAVKDGNYNILGELRDLESASNAGFAQQQVCCCETNRNIDSVRYDMSNLRLQSRRTRRQASRRCWISWLPTVTAIWSGLITSRACSLLFSRLSAVFPNLPRMPTSWHPRGARFPVLSAAAITAAATSTHTPFRRGLAGRQGLLRLFI